MYFVYPQGACRIRKAAKPPTAAQGTPLQTQLVCTFLSAPCTNWKCLPEIATGAKRPRNDKPLAISILTPACADRQPCAGPGCPLPYIGRCNSAVPSRDCTPRALPRASRSGRHVGLRPPCNDKLGGITRSAMVPPNPQSAWRSLSAATDAIGFPT